MIRYNVVDVRCSEEYREYEGHLTVYKNNKEIAHSIDSEPYLNFNKDFSEKEVEDDSEYGFGMQFNNIELCIEDLLNLARILNWWKDDSKEEPTDLRLFALSVKQGGEKDE